MNKSMSFDNSQNSFDDSQNGFECSFCNKFYATETFLKNHQKRNKKCLLKQGKEGLKCKFCDKCYISQEQLHVHINICRYAKDKEIENLKKEIEKINPNTYINEMMQLRDENALLHSAKNENEILKKYIEKLENENKKMKNKLRKS
jgi:hypothetical protein